VIASDVRLKKKVYDSPEELRLVHRAKRGDKTAFEALYVAHHRHVVVTITGYVKDIEAAEWIANKALTNVWKALPKFRERSKFSTWITRIAINEAQMHLRSEKRRQREVSLDALLSGDENSSDASYAQRWLAIRDLKLEGIADRQLLERAMGQIPEQFRKLLRLRLWEGLSLDEIRARVGGSEPVSISAVKSRILRGRNLLIRKVGQIS